MTFFLYNYRRCPFCIRVRLVFLFKGLVFEQNEENLRNRSEGLIKFHGKNKPTVPVLVHDGKPIFESLDIMLYVNRFAELFLSEQDFWYWGDWSAKEFRDSIQLYKYEKGELKEKGKKQLQDFFDFLDEKLNPCLTGSTLALADFAVWPFVRQALRINSSELQMRKSLSEWFSLIENHPMLKPVMDKK